MAEINLSLTPVVDKMGWGVYNLAGFECNARVSHPNKQGNERSVRLKFEAPEGYGVAIAIQLHGGAGPVPEGTHQLVTIQDIVTAILNELSQAVEQTFEEPQKEKEW